MAHPALAALAAGLTLAAGCGRPSPAPMASGAWEVMGTIFTVGAWGRDSAALAAAVSRAYDSLRLVDSLLATDRDHSEISRVNRGAGSGGRPVSATLAAVLGEALRVARRSGGAFDPTLRDWPTQRDWRGVAFDRAAGTVRLQPGLRLDLRGIARGYALDRAALALAGVADSAVLSLGGHLLVLGESPHGTGRPVGISDPDNPLVLLAVVHLPPGRRSVSTSPQAEQTGHIVDPRTGRAAARARSVTVVASTALAANAWSAALFVLGCDSALAFAAGQAGDGAVAMSVLCADDRVRWTADLDGRVSLPTDSPPSGRGP